VTTLKQRINDRSARVAVVGLGYVGFPLAQRATEAGYPVVGIDKYLTDERDKELADAGIHVERGFDSVEQCDIVLICVPTPLVDGEQPDISFITDAVEDIARHLNHTEMLVVLESTSYPGTTRELLLPVLEKAGKRLGQGLNLAYAPERVDPGDNRPDYADIRASWEGWTRNPAGWPPRSTRPWSPRSPWSRRRKSPRWPSSSRTSSAP